MTAVLEFNPETHTYLLDGKERVSTTTLLKRNGLYKNDFATDEHLWRGKAVHEAMHYHHKGTLDRSKLDAEIAGYIAGWLRFERETGFKALGWETPFWHPVYDYTGTPDVWGECKNEIWVPDYKTGAVPEVTRLQLASYVLLLLANKKISADKPIRRMGIQLCSDGDYKIKPFDDPSDYHIWNMIISVHNWGKNNV